MLYFIRKKFEGKIKTMENKSVNNFSNQVMQMNLKLNKKENSFKDEKYNPELFEEQNILLAEIKSFDQIRLVNNKESIMDILNSSSTT